MFTVKQIKTAHGKVKSGADFPAYIKEIKLLGVTYYVAYVTDGHIDYFGPDDYVAKVEAKYSPLVIANTVRRDVFTTELKAHQQGKRPFLAFITMCAETGIEKWEICMDKMTCTYFDSAGNVVLVEQIPH